MRSERKSAAATSRFVLPSATSAATLSSAGVSAPSVGARPLMRLSSRARPLRPQDCAHALERRERLLEGGARLAPALRAALGGAEREQRPRAVEGKLGLGMSRERLLERGEGTVEVARLR